MWPNPMEFPTTHVLIDNDINYLRGISTILPHQNKIYRYFTNAEEALAWINQSEHEKNCGIFAGFYGKEFGNSGMDSEIGNVHRVIYNHDRFNFISTVLVDYDMPGMNGVDLCRSINDQNIQKILLTGFFSEKEARHALNKNWIDMFLPKGEDSAQKISELIFDADINYFNQRTGVIRAIIQANRQSVAFDTVRVRDFFSKTHISCNAVEYYMLSPIGDYLFVDREGTTTGLSIQDAERRKGNIELATELSVPANILKQMKSGQALFCHYGDDGLPEGKHWRQFLFPTTFIDKDQGLLGTAGKKVFSNISEGITAFRPMLDKSVEEAVKLLNRKISLSPPFSNRTVDG